jgi:hypothetical protein
MWPYVITFVLGFLAGRKSMRNAVARAAERLAGKR